jgi:predicted GIY-YIG superfamily endonuclease
MKEKLYCVYMLTSPSGKNYIGLTNDFKRRMEEHKYGHNKKSLVYKFVNKYGWDNITKVKLHENLTIDEANRLEYFEINCRNTITPNGYNLREGGNQFAMTQETRDKISKALTGYKRSPEFCEKLRARMIGNTIMNPEAIQKRLTTMIGYTHTEETRVKMSESHKNRPPVTEQYINDCKLRYDGRFQTPESIEKSRLARLGVKQSEEHAAKSRVASLGSKRNDEFKQMMSDKFKGRDLGQDWVNKVKSSLTLRQFNIELPVFEQNRDMFKDTEFLTADNVMSLIGVSKMTVIKRIKEGSYPNAFVDSGYRGRQPYKIPFSDIENYYKEKAT